MSEISIVSVNPKSVSPELLRQWAERYCEVWKEEPWCEDFWQPEKVLEDIREHLAREGMFAFVATLEGEVVGFTLGYTVDERGLQKVAGHNLMDGIFENHRRVFYVAELAVVSLHRGKRISQALTSALLRAVRSAGICAVVLRTDVKATIACHLYKKNGFVDLEIRDALHKDRTYWLLEEAYHG